MRNFASAPFVLADISPASGGNPEVVQNTPILTFPLSRGKGHC